MRTYDPTQLTPHDPTSFFWALAWARRFAGDVPTEGGAWPPSSLQDEEWAGWLGATAIVYNGATYYRPHEAAARALESDPRRLLALNLSGVSQQYRDPAQVAAQIRAAGGWVDELIRQRSGASPVEELWPVF